MLHSFLSQDWAGLAMAGIMALFAVGLWRYFRKKWMAAPFAALALAMAIGSIAHLRQVSGIEGRFPPPGKYVEVGGQAIHLLAEGAKGSGPTIVMFGGSHAPGTAMRHLHDGLKDKRADIVRPLH